MILLKASEASAWIDRVAGIGLGIRGNRNQSIVTGKTPVHPTQIIGTRINNFPLWSPTNPGESPKGSGFSPIKMRETPIDTGLANMLWNISFSYQFFPPQPVWSIHVEEKMIKSFYLSRRFGILTRENRIKNMLIFLKIRGGVLWKLEK